MVSVVPKGVRRWLREVAAGLRTSHLAMLLAILFLADLFLLDPIPFLDEVMLGLLAILVSRWRGRHEVADEARKPPTKNVTPRPSP